MNGNKSECSGKERERIAKQDLLEILQQGASTWNAWRARHPSVQLSLSRLDLSGQNLHRYDLGQIKFRDANLSRANLSETNLREANLAGADLSEASLWGSDLRYANLSQAIFHQANLSQANLHGAILKQFHWKVDWSGVNLQEANLSHANLRGANLSGADLDGVNISHADLRTPRHMMLERGAHSNWTKNATLVEVGRGSSQKSLTLSYNE